MPWLKFDEAESLAGIFGDNDYKVGIVLDLFDIPMTRYEAWALMGKLVPKQFRIPKATLYRKVQELERRGFLEVTETKEFVRGRLRLPMPIYRSSFKGRIASVINTYVMNLHPRLPQVLRERVTTDITYFESIPSASIIIAFLRWHRARNIDLSNARLDAFYILYTGLMAMRDHADDIADPSMREYAENLRKMSDKLEDTYSKEMTKLTSQRKAQLEMELRQRLLPSRREGLSD